MTKKLYAQLLLESPTAELTYKTLFPAAANTTASNCSANYQICLLIPGNKPPRTEPLIGQNPATFKVTTSLEQPKSYDSG